MRKEIILCDKCKQESQIPLPPEWITLNRNGIDGKLNEVHFCSEQCIFDWMVSHWPVTSSQPAQQPQDKPACKARRFLLVDEAANITEGVKWSDGRVQLETAAMREDDFVPAFYKDWENFKAAHDGSGVQWIDQEVAE